MADQLFDHIFLRKFMGQSPYLNLLESLIRPQGSGNFLC